MPRIAFRLPGCPFMLIEDATKFGSGEWHVATRETPALTLHALYLESDPVRCFGLKGPTVDRPFALTFVAAVEALPSSALLTNCGYVPGRVGAFDGIAYVSGPHRRFLNGWTQEDGGRIVHLFPAFDCEFAGLRDERAFVEEVRLLDLFDPARQPNPHFEIIMQDGASKLHIGRWTKVPFTQLAQYAKILEGERRSTLSVRNIRGDVLEFGGKYGWNAASERIRNHVFLTS